MNPKFFIGPMSLNIVDSLIEYSNENSINIGIIPSRRQIEYDGGYVNNWKTEEFCKYIRTKTNKLKIVRDHGGPDQGNNKDDGKLSLYHDCMPGNMDIIHIDVWKKYNENINEGISKTIELIEFCYNLNNKIEFEIGTEESIKKIDSDELDYIIKKLKESLDEKIFDQIKYAVIQSGTALKNTNNIGNYSKKRLIEMLSVVKKYNLISKEHNGDFLEKSLIYEKFETGLNSINIAPEFGQIETKFILKQIEYKNNLYFDKFFKICLDSQKWTKWVDENFDPEKNKKELILICGHYVLSNEDFLDIKKDLDIKDCEIKQEIKNKLDYYINL